MSLKKNGEKLLEGPQDIRFIQIFNYLTCRFHWGNFYHLQDEGKCGQFGWAYSLVLLSKYGAKPQKSEFYSLKLIRTFERELWDAQQQGKEGKVIQEYHRTNKRS